MKTLQRLLTGIGLSVGAYALLLRPRMLAWGATEEERRESLPGTRLVPGGTRSSTMAVTLDAPPSKVWPWLIQMGFDRAGWYSWDRLDRFGIPSARRLHPEWQALSVGQRLRATPDGDRWFEVAALEPERLLALRACSSRGRQYDSARPRPRTFSDSVWAFHLKPLPGGRTRLVVTVHGAGRPSWSRALLGALFWEPAHFVMQTRQFQNLKARLAEVEPAPAVAGWSPEPPSTRAGAPRFE
jgi:proline iminopeptidase